MNESPHLPGLLVAMYRAMFDRFGHRNWWPADSPFEVCVGAVLTQNTAWKNVEKAINNLKARSALDAFAVHKLSPEELAEHIRPSGYYNVKARRLKSFVDHLFEKHSGSLDSLFSQSVWDLRNELLSIKGIGQETADSIVLYAAQKSIFVVDAYTRRILFRHGLISKKEDYQAIQRLFQGNLPLDMKLFNDYHAQIVAVGHYYCKPKPLCAKCPLQSFLDGNQPRP
jgi:endonuclease III related protein